MLATAAALQLLLLAQPAPIGETPAEPAPPAAPGESAPPPPAPPAADEAATPPAGEAPARPRPPPPRQHSLLTGESLRGGSAALAWAGWPEIGLMYGIGFTERDDGGFLLSHDWAKSETSAGVFWRRPLSKAGPFDMAFRLAVAWWVNSGATFIYDENHSDRGFEVAPGLSLSRLTTGGVLSVLLDAPMVVTGKYDTGFLFTPRVAFAFETPLDPSFSVGARVGAGYRAGAGDAPLKDGRGELQFVVFAGYQLL